MFYENLIPDNHILILYSVEKVTCLFAFFVWIYLGSDKQKKEETVESTSNSHCFYELQPETVYRISVHSRLATVESTAVTILHPTGETLVHS